MANEQTESGGKITPQTLKNLKELEEQFVDRKWYPEDLKPKNPYCLNITREMVMTVRTLNDYGVPLSYLWRKDGLYRKAIKTLCSRGDPRLTQPVTASVLEFVKENFKSGLKWKIPEDTTEYGPRKKKRNKDGSEDEKEVIKYEKIEGVNDVSGVINPDSPELKLRFERVQKEPRRVKKPSSSDSSSDSEPAVQGGKDDLARLDFEDSDAIADPEPKTPLGRNALSALLKTVDVLGKRGKWLSSKDIFNCMKLHKPLVGWRWFEPGFPFTGKACKMSNKLPANLVFIQHFDQHWLVAHLDCNKPSIDVYDSAEDKDRVVKAVKRLKAWVVENTTNLDCDGKGASHFKSIKCHKMPCARQEDGFSCGIFAVKFASALIEGKPIPRDVDPEHERAYYARELRKMASADDVDVDVKFGEALCPSSLGTSPDLSLSTWPDRVDEVPQMSEIENGTDDDDSMDWTDIKPSDTFTSLDTTPRPNHPMSRGIIRRRERGYPLSASQITPRSRQSEKNRVESVGARLKEGQSIVGELHDLENQLREKDAARERAGAKLRDAQEKRERVEHLIKARETLIQLEDVENGVLREAVNDHRISGLPPVEDLSNRLDILKGELVVAQDNEERAKEEVAGITQEIEKLKEQNRQLYRALDKVVPKKVDG